MFDKEMEDQIRLSVDDAIKQCGMDGCLVGIDKVRHDEEHRFLDKLIKLSDRLDNIGWGAAGAATKTIVVAVVGSVLSLIVLGFLVWIKAGGNPS